MYCNTGMECVRVCVHVCMYLCVDSIKTSLSRLSLMYLKSESEVETINFQINIMI